MSGRAHAKLSASGAERWLACPPSAALESTLPDTTSEFAAEGTAAHEMAELMVSYNAGRVNKSVYTRKLNTLRAGEYYDHEMEQVIGEYANHVWEVAAALPGAHVETETRVDFGDIVPGGFGTADVVIVAEPVLHVIDLKYGRHVAVSAEDNPQLMLYAYGTLRLYEPVYNIKEVRMSIEQPRRGESSTYILPADDLRRWGTEHVAPIAQLAAEGRGEYNPGEDTCRWCRAKNTCKALAQQQIETAKADFASVTEVPAGELTLIDEPTLAGSPTLTTEEIAQILTHAGPFKQWYSKIEEHALVQARDHGAHYPGWKLVEGRSTRQITDADGATLALAAEGIPEGDYMTAPALMGITALEKALTKKRFGELLGKYVVKPPGKPALVPETDSRPEIGSVASAKEDFKEV
jgi:hypothetical protein